MKTLFLDTETFSETPIKHGQHRYSEKAEILLSAHAFDDDAPTVTEFPTRQYLQPLIDEADEVVCHNMAFDRTLLRNVLSVNIPLEKAHCTMARALAHGLPGALGTLCDVMGVPAELAKDKAGAALIRLFCMPPAKNLKRGRATKATHPAEWERFKVYAAGDIPSMRSLYQRLPRWNYQGRELELWRQDQRINDRGVKVDIELATAALSAIDKAKAGLNAYVFEKTNEAVKSASQRDAMLGFILSEYGVDLPDMQGSTLERRIADPDLPKALRELLGVRLQTATTSTAKWQTLLRVVNADGRLRGTIQFCGASRTGRDASRLFQVQNLVRPDMKNEEIELGIEALKVGCAELVFSWSTG